MSVNMLIHMLEGVTACLFVFLCFQIGRHYQLSNKQKSQRSKPFILPETPLDAEFKNLSDVFNQLDAAHEEIQVSSVDKQIVTSVADQSEALPSAERVESEGEVKESVTATQASAILDDYIGGFFSEPSTQELEIKAFRAVEKQEASSFIDEPAGNDKNQVDALLADIADTVDLSSYKATKAADVKDQIPTLKTQIPERLLTEHFLAQAKELDDEVIIVEEAQDTIARDDVMSDKVVLAMLDEAKLVNTH